MRIRQAQGQFLHLCRHRVRCRRLSPWWRSLEQLRISPNGQLGSLCQLRLQLLFLLCSVQLPQA